MAQFYIFVLKTDISNIDNAIFHDEKHFSKNK